jgi:hypothetical protein
MTTRWVGRKWKLEELVKEIIVSQLSHISQFSSDLQKDA